MDSSSHKKNNRKIIQTLIMALFVGSMSLSVPALALDVTLAWDAPNSCIDGSPLSDLQGYKVLFGETSGLYTQCIDTASTDTSLVITGLQKGVRYFFTVKAYTRQQNESENASELAWAAPVLVDTDQDGIDDDWETAHFQQLDQADGAASDQDQDGINDLDEFVAGTNPSDPQDAPYVQIVMQDGQVIVMYQTIPASGAGYLNRSRRYSLEQCNDLRLGQWQPVAGEENILAAGQTETYRPGEATSTVYYKTRIELD